MSVREYIGARYVPLFVGEWDGTKSYEPLSVVSNQGNSYTSRQYVPIGTELSNEDYWAATGNYNAQLEQYRKETQNVSTTLNTIYPLDTTPTENSTKGATSGGIYTAVSNALDEATTSVVGTSRISNNAVTLPKLANEVQSNIWQNAGRYSDKNLVIFGDSYLAPDIANSVNGYAAQEIADTLEMALYNYAVGGAGFGRSTNLISTQLDTANTALSTTQKNQTALVICMAGCNDLLNSVSNTAIVNGIKSFIDTARTTFPHAKIVIIPFNWGFGGLTTNYVSTINNVMNSVMTWKADGTVVVPYAWSWNIGYHSRFQNAIHPNQNGYDVIIAHILNAVNGGPSVNFTYYGIINNFTNGSGYLEYTVRDDRVYVQGAVSSSTSGNQTLDLLTCTNSSNPLLVPESNLVSIPLVNSGLRACVGDILFNRDGTVQAAIGANYTVADSNCYFNGSFNATCGLDW